MGLDENNPERPFTVEYEDVNKGLDQRIGME